MHGRDHVHGPHLDPWALLPVGEFGCGSVTSCWRGFAERASAGVFERLQEVLLDCDHPRCRGSLTRRRIKVRIARKGGESSERLGRQRWKAERTIAWLAGCRRLRVRYERDSERFFAFAMLACPRLCANRLPDAMTGVAVVRSVADVASEGRAQTEVGWQRRGERADAQASAGRGPARWER